MHLDFLVEEISAEVALRNILPRILGQATFSVHPFQGKADLLANLPQRLAAYNRWLPPDRRIVVLVDRDTDDCRRLKEQLETMARRAGLLTPSTAKAGRRIQVLNRLAIEELEAWFFGDAEALRAAYPRVPPGLHRKAWFRDPDGIRGGTWEALERVLKRAGHLSGRLPKVEVARAISRHMLPDRNRSKSFQVFRDGVLRMARSA